MWGSPATGKDQLTTPSATDINGMTRARNSTRRAAITSIPCNSNSEIKSRIVELMKVNFLCFLFATKTLQLRMTDPEIVNWLAAMDLQIADPNALSLRQMMTDDRPETMTINDVQGE